MLLCSTFQRRLRGLLAVKKIRPLDRVVQNEEVTAKFMNDKEFQQAVGKHLLKEVYEQIRSERPPANQ